MRINTLPSSPLPSPPYPSPHIALLTSHPHINPCISRPYISPSALLSSLSPRISSFSYLSPHVNRSPHISPSPHLLPPHLSPHINYHDNRLCFSQSSCHLIINPSSLLSPLLTSSFSCQPPPNLLPRLSLLISSLLPRLSLLISSLLPRLSPQVPFLPKFAPPYSNQEIKPYCHAPHIQVNIITIVIIRPCLWSTPINPSFNVRTQHTVHCHHRPITYTIVITQPCL